jgi:hypothetical protein
MHDAHPIDRFARRIRGVVIILAALSLPIGLFSYGWMLKDALAAWPLWASIPAIVAQVVVWMGVASLIDARQDR